VFDRDAGGFRDGDGRKTNPRNGGPAGLPILRPEWGSPNMQSTPVLVCDADCGKNMSSDRSPKYRHGHITGRPK
jgi:hypothetical protein